MSEADRLYERMVAYCTTPERAYEVLRVVEDEMFRRIINRNWPEEADDAGR